MANKSTGPNPAELTAFVLENRRLSGANFLLRLGGCGALEGARPGQFVMVRGAWGRDPLLPRAFSILRVRPTGEGECDLLVKAMGRGTALLAAARPADPLYLLGPLGQPFAAPQVDRRDLLVAGGVGLAPLLWHAEEAHRVGATVELFYGARSANDLVLLDDIAAAGCVLHIATEDGSRGHRGRVTALLEERLLATAADVVLTCGPNAMMRAVVAIARQHSRPTFVSVEGEMACGIGACLGCAVPIHGEQAGRFAGRRFAYACVDGPVFAADEIEIP